MLRTIFSCGVLSIEPLHTTAYCQQRKYFFPTSVFLIDHKESEMVKTESPTLPSLKQFTEVTDLRNSHKVMNHGENNSVILLLVAVGVPVAYYWLQVARRKREVIRYKIRRVLLYVACICFGIAFIPRYGYSIQEAAVLSMFVGATAAFILVSPTKTTRRIPQGVRRAVITRFEAAGNTFNSKLHDIDHIVPFSKGGDHSEENLRVVARSQNRSRGAKMPKFRDFHSS